MKDLFDVLVDEVPEGASILDIGIGDGQLTEKFAKQINPKFLKGIETEPKTICEALSSSKVELLYNQPIQSLLEENKYDLVIMFRTLHYTSFPEPEEAILIAKKLLVKNGLLLLGLELAPNINDGDRRFVNMQAVEEKLRVHHFNSVYCGQVDEYDLKYSHTHILLYRLLQSNT